MKSAITYLFTVIFLFSSFWSISQTSLDGKVTDASSGEAIIFANVIIYKNDNPFLAVNTDINGKYIFSDVEAGTYDIEASYTGYESQKQVGVLIKNGRKNRVDFAINVGALLDEIIVIPKSEPSVSDFSSLPLHGAVSGVTISGKSDGSPLRIRGTSYESSSYTSTTTRKKDLPKSGQITVGEWNDFTIGKNGMIF